jgi:hypothetical protein
LNQHKLNKSKESKMDLSQTKLTKTEWVSIEIPVCEEEKKILGLIHDGYENLNIRENEHSSIMSLMKMEFKQEIEIYIYKKYFEKNIIAISLSMKLDYSTNKNIDSKVLKNPKKSDMIRLNHMDKNIENQKEKIFEFTLLRFCNSLSKVSKKKKWV